MIKQEDWKELAKSILDGQCTPFPGRRCTPAERQVARLILSHVAPLSFRERRDHEADPHDELCQKYSGHCADIADINRRRFAQHGIERKILERDEHKTGKKEQWPGRNRVDNTEAGNAARGPPPLHDFSGLDMGFQKFAPARRAV